MPALKAYYAEENRVNTATLGKEINPKKSEHETVCNRLIRFPLGTLAV